MPKVCLIITSPVKELLLELSPLFRAHESEAFAGVKIRSDVEKSKRLGAQNAKKKKKKSSYPEFTFFSEEGVSDCLLAKNAMIVSHIWGCFFG